MALAGTPGSFDETAMQPQPSSSHLALHAVVASCMSFVSTQSSSDVADLTSPAIRQKPNPGSSSYRPTLLDDVVHTEQPAQPTRLAQ